MKPQFFFSENATKEMSQEEKVQLKDLEASFNENAKRLCFCKYFFTFRKLLKLPISSGIKSEMHFLFVRLG